MFSFSGGWVISNFVIFHKNKSCKTYLELSCHLVVETESWFILICSEWQWHSKKAFFIKLTPVYLFHKHFMCVTYSQGDQMFLWKNCPKTMKNRPKSHPTMFLLDLQYKTVLWCFQFDFMLISNGTGHSFIVFFT